MRTFIWVVVAAIALLLAVVPASAAPNDGNGNQFVVVVDETVPIDCGAGGTIEGHASGWFKGREFQGGGNRNIELTVFHLVLTYTNEDGATFRYIDVGPDHSYIDNDGNFVITITGRPGGSNGASLQGHWVLVFDAPPPAGNLISITSHGNLGPTSDELACDALT
jgi:hypothetical protein